MKKYNIITFETLNSTNTYSLQNIDTLNDKTVILANSQTDGHGKFKREWVSENTNNIYATLILKPQHIPSSNFFFSNLTQFLSVIICDTLKLYDVFPSIKWPNDILIADKKICGILAERNLNSINKNAIVIGFGINLKLTNEELNKITQKATSLSAECNKDIDKLSFLTTLLDAFFEEYDSFLLHGFKFIKEKYINYSNFLGKKLIIKNFTNSLEGIAKQINDDGILIIEDENHNEIKIITGEIN